jgi:hypothetical protein
MVSSKTTGMSPEEMRARADLCKRMALSFGPTNSEMMREVADLWHRLAADADARAANPLRPFSWLYSVVDQHVATRMMQ